VSTQHGHHVPNDRSRPVSGEVSNPQSIEGQLVRTTGCGPTVAHSGRASRLVSVLGGVLAQCWCRNRWRGEVSAMKAPRGSGLVEFPTRIAHQGMAFDQMVESGRGFA